MPKKRQKLADTNLMLDTRVLSLCVFTDENRVDIVVWSFVSGNGNARPNVGEKVESPPECQIEGNMTLSNCPRKINIEAHRSRMNSLGVARGPLDLMSEKEQRLGYVFTFEGHGVSLDGVDSSIWNDSLTSLQNGRNVNLLPLDWDLTEHCQTIKMYIQKYILWQRCKYP